MPFKSAAQRRFLFAKHPDIARRWAQEEKAVSKSLVEIAKAVKLPDGSWVRMRAGKRLAESGRHEIGAYRKGKNVGYLTLRDNRLPNGELQQEGRIVHDVLVRRQYRRQGIGTAMWKRAEGKGLQPRHNWGNQSTEGRAWANTTPEK